MLSVRLLQNLAARVPLIGPGFGRRSGCRGPSWATAKICCGSDCHAQRRCRIRGTSLMTKTQCRVLASLLSCTNGRVRCFPHTRCLRAMHLRLTQIRQVLVQHGLAASHVPMHLAGLVFSARQCRLHHTSSNKTISQCCCKWLVFHRLLMRALWPICPNVRNR